MPPQSELTCTSWTLPTDGGEDGGELVNWPKAPQSEAAEGTYREGRRGGRMRSSVPLIALAVFATVASTAGAIGSRHEAAVTVKGAVAELQLAPSVARGPRGVGLFRQTGARLRGWVVVWGLDPHSLKHAVHFHGPNSACGEKADPVAAHADLKADSKGVAYAKVELRSRIQVLMKGFYYNVHRKPSSIAGQNPEIACGNVVPIS
jgi:hypothetical protein